MSLLEKIEEIDEKTINTELSIDEISIGDIELPTDSHDRATYDLSIDRIAPCNDKYLKNFKYTWKKIKGVYYIHNNKNDRTSKEIRSEKYKYISPQMIEDMYNFEIEVTELSNQFIISIKNIDHNIIIIDNVISVAKGAIIIDGVVYIFKHTAKDITLVLKYLSNFDIDVLKPLKASL